jgi:hypothetical protein
MKGQYRIINEILLFGIAAAIVFSVAGIIAFATASLKSQTQREQYYLMGDFLSLGLTKIHLCGDGAECRFISEIPGRLSEDRYTIELNGRTLTISNFETGQSIQMETLDFNRTMKGFATSSGRHIVIDNIGGEVTLTR